MSLILLMLLVTPISSQKSANAPAGIAWEVRGVWQIDGAGAPIVTGDYVQTGSLLQPKSLPEVGVGNVNYAVTVLLPDGQLIFYECFTKEDCSRGFRVPQLYRTPEPFAVDMLTRIHGVLRAGDNLSPTSNLQGRPRLPRDEAVAVLGQDNRIHVEGLAARLPNGHYTYDLRPLDRKHPREFHRAIEKSGPAVTLSVPSPGLYFVTITDSLNTPRIDLFISAVEPAQAANIEKSYRSAAAMMKEWNTYYQGWPVHDFQRAYLESLLLNVNAPPPNKQADAMKEIPSSAGLPGRIGNAAEDRAGVTAEPVFSPQPGLFDADIAITIQSKTPGAAIHFTVDGSVPVTSSPVYVAPIIVKGTELIIKSFASVMGKKDSPVVTGIFRIKE